MRFLIMTQNIQSAIIDFIHKHFLDKGKEWPTTFPDFCKTIKDDPENLVRALAQLHTEGVITLRKYTKSTHEWAKYKDYIKSKDLGKFLSRGDFRIILN